VKPSLIGVIRISNHLLFLRNKYNQIAKMIQSIITRIRTIQVEGGVSGNNPVDGVKLGVAVGSREGDGVMDGV
jgi:hypothetical protein